MANCRHCGVKYKKVMWENIDRQLIVHEKFCKCYTCIHGLPPCHIIGATPSSNVCPVRQEDSEAVKTLKKMEDNRAQLISLGKLATSKKHDN
jgi:hypothetical protein